jgi:hypothetical protein
MFNLRDPALCICVSNCLTLGTDTTTRPIVFALPESFTGTETAGKSHKRHSHDSEIHREINNGTPSHKAIDNGTLPSVFS